MAFIGSDQYSTTMGTLRVIAIEIGIIVFFIAILLASLNQLNVIDLDALFLKPEALPQQSTYNQKSTTTAQKTSKDTIRAQNNAGTQYLSHLGRNNALHYAQSSVEFEGKIKSIDTKAGIDRSTGNEYMTKIILNIGTDSATTTFMYPKEAVSKVKILDFKNKPLVIEDIKVNDPVVINIKTGILRKYPNNFNAIVITKK